MSEPPAADAGATPDALLARIERLQRDGGAQVDPAGLRFLQALSRRMAAQPDSVRERLQARVLAALDAHATRAGPAVPVARIVPKTASAASPLAQLNQAIRAARANAASQDDADDADELASVRRFRRTWTSLRIQDQVDDAVARKPANAGPLNSHVLVLQSLDLMRALSPRYLERFLVHVETLQWLEEAAAQKPAEPQDKPGKAGRKARKS
jgi:hypothetical protein